MKTKHKGLSEKEIWFDNIQANILKGIGRVNKKLICLELGNDVNTNKELMSKIPVTSFKEQLEMSSNYKLGLNDGNLSVFNVYISASGYRKLGFSNDKIPGDAAYREGMKNRQRLLDDIDVYETPYTNDLDVLVSISNDSITHLDKETNDIISLLETFKSIKSIHIEHGNIIKSKDDAAIGHFGFQDGKSQPLFMTSDIQKNEPALNFDASAPKELVLTTDPNVPDAYGSFIVYRKYEQHVKTFYSEIKRIAKRVNTSYENVASHIFGWQRDGTALANNQEKGSNDFNYDDDFSGSKCPFHAHSRKVNSRKFGEEKDWRILRRSVSYGDRTDDIYKDDDNKPDSDVGLLFIGFMNSIENQFEHVQTKIANNQDFPSTHTGIDPLIGNGNKRRFNFNDGITKTEYDLKKLVTLKGGEYLFAPSITFLKTLSSPIKDSKYPIGNPSTARTLNLRDNILDRAFEDRRADWIQDDQLPNIFEIYKGCENESIVTRRALAFKEMMNTLITSKNTFDINDGELIAGVLPMGSVGLGKRFPDYLTQEETRASAFCNRDASSVFGHTVPNFSRVMKKGLTPYIKELKRDTNANNKELFGAIVVSCESIISYAETCALKYQELVDAIKENGKETTYLSDYLEVIDICKHIPSNPVKTFHEALQFIYFLHLAQTVDSVFNSLGRLDQVLNEYLESDLENNRITEERALELVECFLLKCASRLNNNPSNLLSQDFLNYGTGIGTRPIYLDQVASCNNFIQNIIVGGQTKEGEDASNKTTLLFLKAVGATGLCTPTLNVRIHEKTPKNILEAIESTLKTSKAGLPIIYNDETIINGLIENGIPKEEALDYCNAGCWEMVLNGKNTFTFGMINMLTVLECSLNEGCKYSQDSQFLRGIKNSIRTPHVSQIKNFDQLLNNIKTHIQFFADNVAFSIANFFLLPSGVSKSPILSLLLDGCIESEKDQTEGGAEYNLGSFLAFAVPNLANSLMAIKQFVFKEKKYTLEEVLEALKSNYGQGKVRPEYSNETNKDLEQISKFERMRRDFLFNAPKFGNANKDVDTICSTLMDFWQTACETSIALVKKGYLPNEDNDEAKKIRQLANYFGPSLKASLGEQFNLHFTYGSGTFGQYSSMGKGVNASSDGRLANQPISPNFSPYSGTATSSLKAIFKSIKGQKLNRFGGGVVTDIRVDGTNQESGFFVDILKNWIASNGNILTISVLSTLETREAFNVGQKVRFGELPIGDLKKYSHLQCRVGGWNSFFITLPPEQQKDQTERALYF